MVLHFIPVELGQKTRKVHLIDAHCVKNKTHYRAKGTVPMTESLFFTCAGIKDTKSSAEYSASWRTTFPTTTTKQSSKDQKKVTKYYLTNPEGESIDEYKENDRIVLNIATRNRIGDSITVSLEDAAFDFEHHGTPLEDDTLSGLAISDDLEQIELKVVAQKNNE